MNDKNMEKMAKLIQAKKDKSASQGGVKMTNDTFRPQGESRPGIKQFKKGGLFDK